MASLKLTFTITAQCLDLPDYTKLVIAWQAQTYRQNELTRNHHVNRENMAL